LLPDGEPHWRHRLDAGVHVFSEVELLLTEPVPPVALELSTLVGVLAKVKTSVWSPFVAPLRHSMSWSPVRGRWASKCASAAAVFSCSQI